jgi:ATP-dependent Clp protease adaptor protein ClpS
MPNKETGEVGGASSGTKANTAGRASTATSTKAAPPKVERLPPFNVLLHNDDHSDMLEVVQAIVELTPLQKEAAVQRMLEAHTRGVALLLTTHKERAELYREQFHTKRLSVTIEPAP